MPRGIGLVWAALLTLGASNAAGQSEIQPMLGVHVLGTTKAAMLGGASLRNANRETWWPMLSGEIGIAGGQVSLGVGRVLVQQDVGGPGAEYTLRLQGSILRTWGDPWHAEPRSWYAGVEMQGTIPLLLGARVGVFRRVAGEAPAGHDFIAVSLLLGWL